MIVGEKRSGTSLISKISNHQDYCTVYRDYMHVHRLAEIVGNKRIDVVLEDSEKILVADEFRRRSKKIGVETPIEYTDFRTLLELYHKSLDLIAKDDDYVVGHKITQAHAIAEQLLSSIPELYMIYVVRDPRAVVISCLKKYSNNVTGISAK